MILGACSAGALQHHPQPGVKRGSVLEATGVGRELHQWLRFERARRPASALDLSSVRERAAIVAPGLSSRLWSKCWPGSSSPSMPGASEHLPGLRAQRDEGIGVLVLIGGEDQEAGTQAAHPPRSTSTAEPLRRGSRPPTRRSPLAICRPTPFLVQDPCPQAGEGPSKPGLVASRAPCPGGRKPVVPRSKPDVARPRTETSTPERPSPGGFTRRYRQGGGDAKLLRSRP